jgi:hypothetical protein
MVGPREDCRTTVEFLHSPPLVVTIAKARGMSWTARVESINAKKNATSKKGAEPCNCESYIEINFKQIKVQGCELDSSGQGYDPFTSFCKLYWTSRFRKLLGILY